MTDISAPTPTPAPAPPPAAPWHAGVEPEVLGHWQNKGWKIDDPKEIALAATKQAREAEKYFGVPADQLLKMPKPNASEADIKAFWQRLGAPAEAKEYDFSAVKYKDKPLEDNFLADLRNSMAQNFVPKDRAAAILAAAVKDMESSEGAKFAEATLKVNAEKEALKKNWGANFDTNLHHAREGARRWGLTRETVAALEMVDGYAATMEKLRVLGVNSSEDTFVDRGAVGGAPTQSSAIAEKAMLMADEVWWTSFLKGDVAKVRQMEKLDRTITGVWE